MIRGTGVLGDIDLFSNFKCAQTGSNSLEQGSSRNELDGTKWAFFGKWRRRCGMNRLGMCGVEARGLIPDTRKGCWWLKTVGR